MRAVTLSAMAWVETYAWVVVVVVFDQGGFLSSGMDGWMDWDRGRDGSVHRNEIYCIGDFRVPWVVRTW